MRPVATLFVVGDGIDTLQCVLLNEMFFWIYDHDILVLTSGRNREQQLSTFRVLIGPILCRVTR